jgi:hypothetical protein
MKNKLILSAVSVVASVSLLQTAQATPITGNIGFNGNAVLDTSSANSATEVVSWNNSVVGGDSGTFAAYSINPSSTVTMTLSSWNFNSGTLPSFWTVTTGGITFTFDLASSYIYSQGGGFLNVNVFGSVTASGPNSAGLDTTTFAGTFSVSNPSQNNTAQFSQNLQFNSVPDGGTTVLLLGSALSGLALIKRKLVA